MERLLVFVFLCLVTAAGAAGETINVPSIETDAHGVPVTLSQDQRRAIVDAAVSAKSRQKTPKTFAPILGTEVPEEVYLHGFRPDTTQKVPLLKEYWYAFLDRQIILAGGSKSKIAAVVDLPQELIADEQPRQGAAEAKGRDPTGSVPSHTSPESIK